MIWGLLRPLLPYLLAAGALYGAWWYVGSLRASNEALRADLRAANDELRKSQAHIRQRIDAERQQRATDAESARLAARARDAVPAVTKRLREFIAVPVPAVAAGDADSGRSCPQAESVARVDDARLAAVEAACAQVDADRSILAAEVLRLERALSSGPQSIGSRPQPDSGSGRLR